MSKFFNLNVKDYIRSVIVAIGTAGFMVIEPTIQQGGMPTQAQFKIAGISAIGAGISYIIKNLFTNSKNELGKPE